MSVKKIFVCPNCHRCGISSRADACPCCGEPLWGKNEDGEPVHLLLPVEYYACDYCGEKMSQTDHSIGGGCCDDCYDKKINSLPYGSIF